jgi:acyl carrier protein
MTTPGLRRELAGLICEVMSGEVGIDEALADGITLGDMGIHSLGLLRLVDAVELRYGVELDLADQSLRNGTLDALAERLVRP